MRTAEELVAEGKRLSKLGHLVVFLYPSQEWMAVQTQTPFLRYERTLEAPHPLPRLGAPK
jgi:hypothetical protein